MMEIAQLLAIILGPAGAAWIGVKVSLNGMHEGQKRIEKKVDRIETTVNQHSIDIAKLQEH